MPGYYIHFASCKPDSRNNLSFLRGVEAPDLLKKHFKLYGIDAARQKYDSLRTKDMPEYDFFEERVKQKEMIGSLEGLHYGVSSNPSIISFWASLSEEQRKNPFFKGYLWHLLTDLLMYNWLAIDEKFQEVLEKNKSNHNIEELRKSETKKLHYDWDRTNAMVRDQYIDVIIPPEIEELGVVQFIEKGPLHYIDSRVIKSTIDYLRKYDPLNENIEQIICKVLMATA